MLSHQELYLKTLGVLWIQILIVVATVIMVGRPPRRFLLTNGWSLLCLGLLQLGLLLVILWSSMSFWPSFWLFTLLSILNGLLLAPLYVQEKYRNGVRNALLSTLVLFLVMTLYGILLPRNWMAGWGRYLFLVLCALLIGVLAQFLMALFGYSLGGFDRLLSVVGVVLFSIYIAYDTNIILGGQNTTTNPVLCALRLYYDLLNLFGFLNRH